MKIFLLHFFILMISIIAQTRDVIQITNDSLSYDNPSMPLQPMNFPHGIPSFFLSEIREGRSINIVMLTYDNLTDSFSSPIFITDNQFINRNAVSSEPAWGRDGLIIWESNKSGNFDLYYKTKSSEDENWSDTKILLSGEDDETNPRFAYDMYGENYLALTFTKNNNLYFAYFQDSLYNLKEVFTSKEGVYYHNIQSFVNGNDKFVLICEKVTADSNTKIVMKSIKSNVVSEEIILIDNADAKASNVQPCNQNLKTVFILSTSLFISSSLLNKDL